MRVVVPTLMAISALGAACSRSAPANATNGPNEAPALASVGKLLANEPVPTVPIGRGGGPTLGAVAVDEARARLANARCKVHIACGREDDLDACATREFSSMSVDDCPLVDSARLDACISETTLRGCAKSDLPGCGIDALCAK